MMNCEHVIVQRVVSGLFFSQLPFHKQYLMSVPKIVKIAYAIYQGLSKIRLCKEYVGRKVHNASGFNFRRNFAFECSPSLSLREIT